MGSGDPGYVRPFIASIATVATIISALLQLIKGWSWSYGFLFLGLVLFCAFFLTGRRAARLKVMVRRTCRLAKERAEETIDIAAGDCSWLKEEIELLEEKMSRGVHVRLLCRPTPNRECRELLSRLAKHPNASVRQYGSKFQIYLRSIIVDAKRPGNQYMVIIDKQTRPQKLLRLLPVPEGLDTDHVAYPVDGSSRLYEIVRVLFDLGFKDGQEFVVHSEPEGA